MVLHEQQQSIWWAPSLASGLFNLTSQFAGTWSKLQQVIPRLWKNPSTLVFFPTCQVRVVGLCVSLPASSFLPPFSFLPPSSAPRRTSTATSRTLDRSVPRRTPTATCGSEWSQPDLHRKLRIKVFRAGPRPRAPDQTVPCRTSTTEDIPDRMPEKDVECQNRMSDRMRDSMQERMPEHMAEKMPNRMPEKMSV